MPKRKLKFALFGNEYQSDKLPLFVRIIEQLQVHQAELYIDKAFYKFLKHAQASFEEPAGIIEDDSFDVDFAVSMGGDGTFLKAASRVGAKQVPLIGINTGRLGFLADILPGEIKQAIDAVYEGNYELEDHTAIQLSIEGENINVNPYALNDIAILKHDNASMISVRACVNDEYLVTYQADGLIVSTPTGSTAYSLSNGGPIMMPSAEILCMTPVAPHSLNIRPIVIGDDCVITLTVESRSHNFLAAIDGRSINLKEGTKVIIKKAPFSVRFVKRLGQRYFSTLREKMMWGADTRG